MSVISKEKHDIKAIQKAIAKEDRIINHALKNIKKGDYKLSIKEVAEAKIHAKKLEEILVKDFEKASDKKFALAEEIEKTAKLLFKKTKINIIHLYRENIGSPRLSQHKPAASDYDLKRIRTFLFKFIKSFEYSKEQLIESFNEITKIIENQQKIIGKMIKLEKYGEKELKKFLEVALGDEWYTVPMGILKRSVEKKKYTIKINKKELNIQEGCLRQWYRIYHQITNQHELINKEQYGIIEKLNEMEDKIKHLYKTNFSEYPKDIRTLYGTIGISAKDLHRSVSLFISCINRERYALKELEHYEDVEIGLEKMEKSHLK